MTKQPDGIWIIDANANTLYANGAMAKILHTTTEEMAGQSSFAYLLPEDMPAAERLFQAQKQGENGHFQFRLRRSDGSAVWVEVQGTPMRNAAGDFIGVVGTFSIRDRNGPE
jgi:PAS domain S-box-containing protein